MEMKDEEKLFEDWRDSLGYDDQVLYEYLNTIEAYIDFAKHYQALTMPDVEERSTGRITVSFFRKVYKQFIDEKISMTKMLEMMTEQAHRTDVCVKCQRLLDGTNVSKTKCNACFAVNA